MSNKTESDVKEAKVTMYFAILITMVFAAISILSYMR